MGRYIGEKLSRKWRVRIEEGGINITEKNNNYFLPFKKIGGMYVGTKGMRYLSLKAEKRIRIRVGTTAFAPYSKEQDIRNIDLLVEGFKPKLIEKNIEVKGGSTDKNIIVYHFIKK